MSRNPNVVKRLWKRQRGKCEYCGCQMTKRGVPNGERQSGTMATLDHITPRLNGGQGRGNLVLACRTCNNKKAAKSLTEFSQSEWLERKRRGAAIANLDQDAP